MPAILLQSFVTRQVADTLSILPRHVIAAMLYAIGQQSFAAATSRTMAQYSRRILPYYASPATIHGRLRAGRYATYAFIASWLPYSHHDTPPTFIDTEGVTTNRLTATMPRHAGWPHLFRLRLPSLPAAADDTSRHTAAAASFVAIRLLRQPYWFHVITGQTAAIAAACFPPANITYYFLICHICLVG